MAPPLGDDKRSGQRQMEGLGAERLEGLDPCDGPALGEGRLERHPREGEGTVGECWMEDDGERGREGSRPVRTDFRVRQVRPFPLQPAQADYPLASANEETPTRWTSHPDSHFLMLYPVRPSRTDTDARPL